MDQPQEAHEGAGPDPLSDKTSGGRVVTGWLRPPRLGLSPSCAGNARQNQSQIAAGTVPNEVRSFRNGGGKAP